MKKKRLGTAQWNGPTLRYRLAFAADRTKTWRDARTDLRRLGRELSSDPAVALVEAQALADRLSREALVAALAPADKPRTSGESYRTWSDRWHADRVARQIVGNDRFDRAAQRTHIFPVIGDRPARHVTTAEVEEIVRRLDAKIVAGEMSWKTAANVWSSLTKSFHDMQQNKSKALVIRTDNPCAGVAPPERGEATEKQMLYPSEFIKLVTSPAIWDASGKRTATAVNACKWMRAVALAIYLEPRAGELRALDWEKDIDLEHWTCRIARAVKRDTGGKQVKRTKTERARRFVIEPAIRPLLLVMHAESGGKGRVINLPHEGDLSERVRRYLLWAGVTRPELHERSVGHAPITWRDLRAVGITWRAMRGDDPLKIQSAAGHEQFSTTQIYIRLAGQLDDTAGAPFPLIPPRLLGRALTEAEHRLLVHDPGMQSRDTFEAAQVSRTQHGPNPDLKFPNHPDSFKQRASPVGFESTSAPANEVETPHLGPVWTPNNPERHRWSATTDPVIAAILVGLEVAVRDGNADDAAALARKAAELTASTLQPNVVRLPARRR